MTIEAVEAGQALVDDAGLDWVGLCAADFVPAGEARAVIVGDLRLCVVNDGSRFYVTDDLCTHGMAFLSEGYCDVDECVLECPLHGGLFSYVNGSPQGDPAEKPIRVYPTSIIDGIVAVQL